MAGSNEYQQNIERLAKGVKIKGPLGPVGTREPIRGKVTPFADDTFAPPSTAPAQYVEPPCNPRDADNETDNTEPQEPIDPADPNTFVRGTAADGQTTEQGTADIGDAIDGTAGPQMPITGGGTSGLGGIRELTGLKDCDSGKEFNLHLDGNFVPPEGWDDPDSPPVDDEYQPGYVWAEGSDDGGGIGTYSYPAQSPGGVFALFNTAEDGAKPFCYSADPLNPDPITGLPTRYLLKDSALSSCNRTITFINRILCSESIAPELQALCDLPAPGAESWPQDDIYDIAVKDGQFQTNQYDGDAPKGFEAGGTKDFCYGDGKTGRAEVTADGGLVYYETDAGGAPVGTARVIDSSGQLVAAGDATDSFISQYLPQ